MILSCLHVWRLFLRLYPKLPHEIRGVCNWYRFWWTFNHHLCREHRAGVRRVGVGWGEPNAFIWPHGTMWSLQPPCVHPPPTSLPYAEELAPALAPGVGGWGSGQRTHHREENGEELIFWVLGVFLVVSRFEECEAKLNWNTAAIQEDKINILHRAFTETSSCITKEHYRKQVKILLKRIDLVLCMNPSSVSSECVAQGSCSRFSQEVQGWGSCG